MGRLNKARLDLLKHTTQGVQMHLPAVFRNSFSEVQFPRINEGSFKEYVGNAVGLTGSWNASATQKHLLTSNLCSARAGGWGRADRKADTRSCHWLPLQLLIAVELREISNAEKKNPSVITEKSWLTLVSFPQWITMTHNIGLDSFQAGHTLDKSLGSNLKT